MSNEGSTRSLHFMTPGAWVLVLRGWTCMCNGENAFFLQKHSTLLWSYVYKLAIVLRGSCAAFLSH